MNSLSSSVLMSQFMADSSLVNCSSVPKFVPVDLMTGLPVQPSIVADTLRIQSKEMEEAVREKPFFITRFFLKLCRIPINSLFLEHAKVRRFVTPYRPLLFPLASLEEEHRYDFLSKYPLLSQEDETFVFLQGKWRRIKGAIMNLLEGRWNLWIEERELLLNGYAAPPQFHGIHIPSPFSCTWFHVDHTLFESTVGYEPVFHRSMLQEKFVLNKIRGIQNQFLCQPIEVGHTPSANTIFKNADIQDSTREMVLHSPQKIDWIAQLNRFSVPTLNRSSDSQNYLDVTCLRYKSSLANLCRTRGPGDPNIPWWTFYN